MATFMGVRLPPQGSGYTKKIGGRSTARKGPTRSFLRALALRKSIGSARLTISGG